MFTQEDLQGLEETFAAARSYIVTTQPKNRDSLAGLLNFENELTAKIASAIPKEEEPQQEEEVKAEA